MSSSHTRYSPSLLLCQTLVIFIYQVQSLTCCIAFSSLTNQSHHQHIAVKSSMELSSSTVCLLSAPVHLHLMDTPTKSSFQSSIGMGNCNHEEADTRIVFHILHALEQGAKTVLVRTVDTDVVVILVGKFHDLLKTQPLTDIWMAFGMGYRYLNINAICESLGESKSQALPVLHSYSGCDTTSAFHNLTIYG